MNAGREIDPWSPGPLPADAEVRCYTDGNRVEEKRLPMAKSGFSMSFPISERSAGSKREMTDGLAAQIFDHIRGAGLPAGTHITAQELAERFSVSRFPVGQALQLLAAATTAIALALVLVHV